MTAGNASQLSDGASMTLLMSPALAERLAIEPMGAFRGFVTAGCEPDEMGIGPVFAIPKLRREQVSQWRVLTSGNSTRPSPRSACIAGISWVLIMIVTM